MIRLILVILFLSGCHNATKPGDDIATDTATLPPATDTPAIVQNFDTLVHLNDLNDTLVLRGKMQGVDKPVSIFFSINRPGTLVATVIPEDSIANIRINQIFTPDNKADGPFGLTITRQVTQQGTYKIILAENMMQGEEWKGYFKLRLQLR